MAWLDGVVGNLVPELIVTGVLMMLIPALRRAGALRGIGAAMATAFVVALLVAVTHLNDVSLSCQQWVGPFPATPISQPCTGSNSLPLWLVALSPLSGIVVLLAWIWRHTRPLSTTLAAVIGLPALAAALLAVGQVSEAGALVGVAAVGVAAYAWPRLRGQGASPGSGHAGMA